MPAYLKIENPGVCPAVGFTLLGASMKGDHSAPGTIGKFGSGNKHSTATLLRANVRPVIFCGQLKLEFFTREEPISDGITTTIAKRLFVKYSGREESGKSRSSNEDMGFTLEYGKYDWTEVSMALREFTSNAIDMAIKWNAHHKKEVRHPWDGATVTVVEESQVRAESGVTRVFVPLNNDVLNFYNNICKWFLHFSEPHLLESCLLPKRNRNLSDKNCAVIYRRGVLVREISGDVPSVFDYNLNNLAVDEARNVDDYKLRALCAVAVAHAAPHELVKIMQTEKHWEHNFDAYYLKPAWGERENQLAARKKNWSAAVDLLGDHAVLVSVGCEADRIARKGFTPVMVSSSILEAAEAYGARSTLKILTEDERVGREVIPANAAAIAAVDWCWDKIVLAGMDNGKQKPPVHCFVPLMNAEEIVHGFYRDGEVYISENISSGTSVALRQTALEELIHFVTGSGDASRDFQEFATEFAVRIAMKSVGEIF
jgi:hypothetical protein